MEEKETIIDQKILERPILYGMFSDKEGAENAYNAMFERGYASEEINPIMSDETRVKSFTKEGPETEMGNKATEGMATGSTIGGTIGVEESGSGREDLSNMSLEELQTLLNDVLEHEDYIRAIAIRDEMNKRK